MIIFISSSWKKDLDAVIVHGVKHVGGGGNMGLRHVHAAIRLVGAGIIGS